MSNADKQAFPQLAKVGSIVADYTSGLTKRELFAAMAMMNLQNVLLRPRNFEQAKELCTLGGFSTKEELIAALACRQADMLIAELERCQHDFQPLYKGLVPDGHQCTKCKERKP